MNASTASEMPHRFWDKVLLGDGCWEWQASLRTGYGQFKYRGRMERAHRVSWLLLVGPVPEGMWVLHHCDNRLCVRPDHLYLGTAKDNARDASVRKRLRQAQLTRCPQGHPYSEFVPGGIRTCAVCQRESQARYQAARSTGTGKGGNQRSKTHCPQGHLYDDENTYWYGKNRQCRACHRIRGRKHEAPSG